MYFTQDEEDLADLLIKIGLKRNVARVLVYLAHNSEATSREIERGTDLRQPEVSLAMAAMIDQDWVENREIKAENKGRPVKIYRLSRPVSEITDTIEKEKREEANMQLSIIQQIRNMAQVSLRIPDPPIAPLRLKFDMEDFLALVVLHVIVISKPVFHANQHRVNPRRG